MIELKLGMKMRPPAIFFSCGIVAAETLIYFSYYFFFCVNKNKVENMKLFVCI